MKKFILICLCILYFIQGMPYGVQKALPLYLHDVLNYKLDFATKTGLLMSPWVILRPLIGSNITSRSSGFVSLIWGMILTCVLNVALSVVVSPFVDLTGSAMCAFGVTLLFSLNFGSVCIDVAADQLAIALASTKSDFKSLGISNSLQVVAYKLGVIFSGITISWFSTTSNALLFQSAVYFASLAATVTLFPRHKTPKATDFFVPCSSFNQQIKNFFPKLISMLKIVSASGTYPLALYVLFYKLGEVGVTTLYPLLLNEKGISRQEINWATALVLDPLSLVGSLLGGVMSAHLHKHSSTASVITKCLGVLGLVRILPMMVQLYILGRFDALKLWVLPSLFLVVLGGATSTLTFVLMMSVSCTVPQHFQTFYYSLLCSLEVLGKLFFGCYVGMLYENFGVTAVYAVCCLSVVFSSFLVFIVQL